MMPSLPRPPAGPVIGRRIVWLAKLALNNGVAGALEGPSAYLMKSPPKQIVDDEACELSEQFIEKYKRKIAKKPAKT